MVTANERAIAQEVMSPVLRARIPAVTGQLEQLPRQRLGAVDLALGHEQLADTGERAHLTEPVARGAPQLETLLEGREPRQVVAGDEVSPAEGLESVRKLRDIAELPPQHDSFAGPG